MVTAASFVLSTHNSMTSFWPRPALRSIIRQLPEASEKNAAGRLAEPPKAASSEPGPSGRPEVAWLDVGSALLPVATALLLVTTVVTVVLGFGAWVATP